MNGGRKDRSCSRRKKKSGGGQWSQRHSSSKQFHNAGPQEARSSRDCHSQYQARNDKTTSRTTRSCCNSRPHTSNSRSRDVSNPQPSTNAFQSESGASDIPGYYYDEQAKLYFKIQSYNLGMVAPFITKDKIVSKQKESQRITDVQNLTSKTLSASASSHKSRVTALTQNSHIVNVLRGMQCGQFTCENMRTHMVRHLCSRIQPDVDWDNSSEYPGLEIQHMLVSKLRDKIACVSSLKSRYSQIIQQMTVEEQRLAHPSETKHSFLRIRIPPTAVGPIHKRIKTVIWAPLSSRCGQSTILYTTVCPIGGLASNAYLRNLDAETDDEQILFELNLGNNIIWSSAWNKHGHKFTVGSERKCCLIDVATRKQWTFSTCDSDPLAQLFSRSCHTIYNGTRKGQILLHDMRAPDRGRYTLIMRQAPGVGCLRLLQDENYLLASDFSGTICIWDQRVCKKVMEYKGLTNSHWQLPFCLDESESLLSSTGSDSYTKIWQVKTGEVLRMIPPIFPVSCDSFPLSFYSTHWGGRDGNSALLVAMSNRFRFYTYKETLH